MGIWAKDKISLLTAAFFLISTLPIACGSGNATAETPPEIDRRPVEKETADYSWIQLANVIDMAPGLLEAVDAQHVWCTSGSEIFFFDGNAWTKQFDAGVGIECIHAASDRAVWATGREGAIFFYDGSAWSEQFRANTTIEDICGVDASHAWAVGNGIYSYDGSAWSLQSSPPEPLIAVAASGAQEAWACSQTTCWHFDGSSWSEQFNPGFFIKDISATSSGRAWMLCSESEALGAYEQTDNHFYIYENGRWRGRYEISASLDYIELTEEGQVWSWNRSGECHGEVFCYYFSGGSWTRVEPGVLLNINCISAPGQSQAWISGGFG